MSDSLRTHQGSDGRAHVVEAGDTGTYCRTTFLRQRLPYFRLATWALADAKDARHHCQECRVRALRALGVSR